MPSLLQNMPPFVLILSTLIGLTLHVLAPALVAIITLGGGITFAAHVVVIASIGASILSGFSLLPGLITLTAYGLLPLIAAAALLKQHGLQYSARYMAAGLGLLVLISTIAGALLHEGGLREFISLLMSPMFEEAQQQVAVSDFETLQVLTQAQQMMISILPGLVALSVWFAWWGDIVLARNFANRYGFYKGDQASPLALSFGKKFAYLFLVLLLLANLASGDLQYIGINAAIMIGGLLAAQGIAVGHSWLKTKNMTLSISMMYLMLFIWSFMIVPFVIVGLMDIWFDYRRKFPAVGG
ncbi:MAG: DUF2232 domain-containing protein [Mariprofundus sp.]|nr:DUF2232 domain-containing protein [Mariprofundus sp.]